MSKLPQSLLQKIVWDQEKNPIWLSSTFNLYRNFNLYKFPGKMTRAELGGSLKGFVESFQKIALLQPQVFLPAEELSPLDKEMLFEHFQCPQNFQQAGQGQGFILDAQGKSLITLNLYNHLQLHVVETSENLLSAWSTLSQIDDQLTKAQPYAFSSRFGYLTSDPLLCGTALEVRLVLHVPALRHTGELGEFLQKQGDEQLTFLSLEGPLSDLVGDFLVLKNRYTVGVSEETILNLLQTMGQKITSSEKRLREKFKSSPSAELKDFVGRSFGLLMHSYQLHPKEALDGLSGLKLGVDLGWVSGITSQKISTLMFQLQRGHLTHLLHLESADPHELAHQRAKWLHQELKGLSITD